MTYKEVQPDIVSPKGGSEHAFLYGTAIFAILVVACLGIASYFYGSRIMSQGREAPATTERRETMLVTQQKPSTNHRMPPIDVSMPAKTETATFALG
ncbi:MAG: hypothetical protein ACLPVO_06740 [Desulfomonilaceae bacterium]